MTSSLYFVNGSLPELTIGEVPDLDFVGCYRLLRTNLSPQQFKQVKLLRTYYDLENIRSFWREQEVSIYGNFDELGLEEALLTGVGFPDYVYDFLDKYHDPKTCLSHFAELEASYFSTEIPSAYGFMLSYLTFEREWRLVASAWRARELGRDLVKELQYEDPEDPFVALLEAQKNQKILVAPEGYEEVVAMLQDNKEPLALHRRFCEWRFDRIAEFTEADTFSLDRILSFVARLILVEQWRALDKKKGKAVVDRVTKEAS